MVAPVIAPIVTSLAKPFFDLMDELFTSDEERSQAKLKLLELEQKGQLAQIAVNLQEAKNESLFVSGWRPAVGWVCVVALAYTYIVQPFFIFLSWIAATHFGASLRLDLLPELDLVSLMPVLLGMLGLGAFRTYEKVTGTNKRR